LDPENSHIAISAFVSDTGQDFGSNTGHRGGGDVVEALLRVGPDIENLGRVAVPGLLDSPSHEDARTMIDAAMRASDAPPIRERVIRGTSWVVLLRSSLGNFQHPPRDLMWPTHAYTRGRIDAGDETVTALFGNPPEGALNPKKRDHPASPHTDEGADGGSDGDAAPSGGSSGGSNSKRVRQTTLNGSGAPASAVRAVLFTSSSPSSLMQVEAQLLLQRGLVMAVVCPESAADISDCLDRLRPRIVIVSARHSGECRALFLFMQPAPAAHLLRCSSALQAGGLCFRIPLDLEASWIASWCHA
jgi:hypothetical protein